MTENTIIFGFTDIQRPFFLPMYSITRYQHMCHILEPSGKHIISILMMDHTHIHHPRILINRIARITLPMNTVFWGRISQVDLFRAVGIIARVPHLIDTVFFEDKSSLADHFIPSNGISTCKQCKLAVRFYIDKCDSEILRKVIFQFLGSFTWVTTKIN